MRVLRYAELDPGQRRALFERAGATMFDERTQAQVEDILRDVRDRGDDATLEALERFDGVRLERSEDQRVSEGEFESARRGTDAGLVEAVRAAISASRTYNERSIRGLEWTEEISPGVVVGERYTPIESAGLYVPCGKGSFPSVLVQIGTPAVVAGVTDLAVVVPPVPDTDGQVDPSVLVVAEELGIENVFRANGVAGVAALAFGTETIPRVRFVVGPGSPPITAAQALVQRYGVATQMVLGPTESVILADGSADPRLVAADLLNEAEHGPDSPAVLVTWVPELVESVRREISGFLASLPERRRGFAEVSLDRYGGAVIVENLEEAVEFVDEFAAEHLMVACEEPWEVASKVQNAGEILVGGYTPFSAANYAIGSPAALPTNGFAKITSPVTAKTFLKFSALASLSGKGFAGVERTVRRFADHEGFPAHRQAAELRLKGATVAG